MRKEANPSSAALATAMAVTALISPGLAGARAGELGEFLAAHQHAAKSAADGQWTAAAESYGAFAATNPRDAGAMLASFLQGLILLRELGQTEAARQAFTRASDGTPTTPLSQAVAQAANAWKARLQMVRLDAALRAYWVDKVEYPAALEELVKHKLVAPEAIVDPWGKPFVYETGRLNLAPDMPRQKYALRCENLEGTSRDFENVLAATRNLGRGHVLRDIVQGRPLGAKVVTPEGRTTIVAEGSKLGGATVVAVARQALVLADPNNLAVLTR